MENKIYCGRAKTVNQGLKLNICLDDIPQEHITTSKNGKRYVKLDAWPLHQVDERGNTHSVKVDTWKPNNS
jgi:hypothetical protein